MGGLLTPPLEREREGEQREARHAPRNRRPPIPPRRRLALRRSCAGHAARQGRSHDRHPRLHLPLLDTRGESSLGHPRAISSNLGVSRGRAQSSRMHRAQPPKVAFGAPSPVQDSRELRRCRPRPLHRHRYPTGPEPTYPYPARYPNPPLPPSRPRRHRRCRRPRAATTPLPPPRPRQAAGEKQFVYQPQCCLGSITYTSATSWYVPHRRPSRRGRFKQESHGTDSTPVRTPGTEPTLPYPHGTRTHPRYPRPGSSWIGPKEFLSQPVCGGGPEGVFEVPGYISPHLPTSPHISPHLPQISPDLPQISPIPSGPRLGLQRRD